MGANSMPKDKNLKETVIAKGTELLLFPVVMRMIIFT